MTSADEQLTLGQEIIAWIETNCRVPEGALIGQRIQLMGWQKRVSGFIEPCLPFHATGLRCSSSCAQAVGQACLPLRLRPPRAGWPRPAARPAGDAQGDAREPAAWSLPGLRLNEHLAHDGESVFRHACKMGLEGIFKIRSGH